MLQHITLVAWKFQTKLLSMLTAPPGPLIPMIELHLVWSLWASERSFQLVTHTARCTLTSGDGTRCSIKEILHLDSEVPAYNFLKRTTFSFDITYRVCPSGAKLQQWLTQFANLNGNLL